MDRRHIFSSHFRVIGKITGVKGLEGALRYVLFEQDEIPLSNACIFFSVDGLPVPYELDGNKSNSDFLFLKGVDNVEEAKQCVAWEILGLLSKEEEEKPSDTRSLLEYKVISDGEIKGEIVKIEQYPSQIMATLRGEENSEKLLPLVEEWIINIDTTHKIIEMDLPSGLL